ncbi:hypothetical protein B296_00033269, partial [Ensete ventricosum]
TDLGEIGEVSRGKVSSRIDDLMGGEGGAELRRKMTELLGDVLVTLVEGQDEVVEVDAEDVGLECGAEAHRRIEVDEAVDESAALAWLLRELADADADADADAKIY